MFNIIKIKEIQIIKFYLSSIHNFIFRILTIQKTKTNNKKEIFIHEYSIEKTYKITLVNFKIHCSKLNIQHFKLGTMNFEY